MNNKTTNIIFVLALIAVIGMLLANMYQMQKVPKDYNEFKDKVEVILNYECQSRDYGYFTGMQEKEYYLIIKCQYNNILIPLVNI